MNIKERILGILKSKSTNKQWVYKNTQQHFNQLKQVLQEVAAEWSNDLNEHETVKVTYSEHGAFECRLSFSGDVLVFLMHSNVFTFDRQHGVYQTPYVKKDPLAAFCGVIYVYNFLADSFRYNRMGDQGSLLARVFINKDSHFFVEGDRQFSFKYNQFETAVLDKEIWRDIVFTASHYALEYDLQIPPMNFMAEISVADLMQLQSEQRLRTAKRLGYKIKG